MERSEFKERLKQYKEAKGFDPQLKYWEWKQKYDSAPQPDNMPSQPQPDQPTAASQPLDDRANRWDNEHYVDPVNTVFDADRYRSWKEPAQKTFGKGRVKFTYKDFMKPADIKNMKFLQSIGRLGKVLKGASIFSEAVQNLFPSEEAELIEDLRVKMAKQNKWLTGQEDIPMYGEGTYGVTGPPTEEEYIAQQIDAKKAAALKKSLSRTMPRVPKIITGEQWNPTTRKVEPIYKEGDSCAYTFADNYGQNWMGCEDFRQNHKKYGWRQIPWEQRQPGNAVLIIGDDDDAKHTMMYDSDNAQGQPLFNHSNGGSDENAIRKKAKYPHHNPYLTYEYVGTAADSTQWKNEYKQLYGYADGGEVDDPRKQILNRSVKVASNYSDAKDFTLDPLNYAIRKISKTLTGRGGISNCTLSATGWVDPNNQYMSARNLFNNPESGYIEIDKAYALPGDLLVAKNPEKDSYHTMLIEGFNGDDPLLRYSRGGHNTKKNLVTGRSLEEYHRLDNEQGGNHTEDHYFRYNIPNKYWLPEIVVTPKK